jgi:hypothetical protein
MAKTLSVKFIEQVLKSGCGLSIGGMVLSTEDPDMTYARMVAIAPRWCHEKCGAEDSELDELLAEHGWAMQRLWKARKFDGEIKEVWPPKPWARMHIASVYQTEVDYDREDGHYVYMDRRGIVYDPADPKHIKCKLDRYFNVEWVAAVIKVK